MKLGYLCQDLQMWGPVSYIRRKIPTQFESFTTQTLFLFPHEGYKSYEPTHSHIYACIGALVHKYPTDACLKDLDDPPVLKKLQRPTCSLCSRFSTLKLTDLLYLPDRKWPPLSLPPSPSPHLSSTWVVGCLEIFLCLQLLLLLLLPFGFSS